jgi:hypothetical protein
MVAFHQFKYVVIPKCHDSHHSGLSENEQNKTTIAAIVLVDWATSHVTTKFSIAAIVLVDWVTSHVTTKFSIAAIVLVDR